MQLVTVARHFVVWGVGLVIGGDVAVGIVVVIIFVAGDAYSTGFAGVGVTGIVVTGIVVVGVDGAGVVVVGGVVGGGEVDIDGDDVVDIDGADVVDIVAEMLLRLWEDWSFEKTWLTDWLSEKVTAREAIASKNIIPVCVWVPLALLGL